MTRACRVVYAIFLAITIASNVTRTSFATTITAAGFTFDDARAPVSAAATSDVALTADNFLEFNYPTFDTSRTVGRLLGVTGPSSGIAALLDAEGPTRSEITMQWAVGAGPENGVGDDFVVFAQGTSPEAYAVAVRASGQPGPSVYRYEFANSTFVPALPDNDVFIATAFDLADFGYGQGIRIGEIRLIAVGIGDSVSNASGEGNISFNNTSGFALRFGGPLGDGNIVTDNRDDEDMVYAAPLIPEPCSALLLAGLFVLRLRRESPA